MIKLTRQRSDSDDWTLYLNPTYIISFLTCREETLSYPVNEDGSTDFDNYYHAVVTRIIVRSGEVYDVTESPDEIFNLIQEAIK